MSTRGPDSGCASVTAATPGAGDWSLKTSCARLGFPSAQAQQLHEQLSFSQPVRSHLFQPTDAAGGDYPAQPIKSGIISKEEIYANTT